MKTKLPAILTLLLLLLTGCDEKPIENKDVPVYVDFEKFKEGRVCSEVKFSCLPESQEKAWQKIPLKDGADYYEITPERTKHYEYLVKAWQYTKEEREKRGMLVSDLDKDFHKKIEAKHFLLEMEEDLEKEFPGFWKDVKKPVRYRWIRRAMAKAKKYGYNKVITDHIQIIELCARIGLDFDLDPKWEEVTKFVAMPDGPYLGYGGAACEYIDFTVFKKDYNLAGDKITDWQMRDALRYLPYPKRPVPRLND